MTTQSVSICKPLTLLCTAALILFPGPSTMANENPDQPNTLELAKLPKYCVAQYYDKTHQMPAYSVKGCGVFMNHFCYGLNFLNRASDFNLPKSKRQWNAGRARTDIDYTKQHMERSCTIAADVSAAEFRLRSVEMMLK